MSLFVSEEPIGNLPNLFLVADGMGGHKAGDLASEYTVAKVQEAVSKSMQTIPYQILKGAFQYANQKLLEKAGESDSYTGMGTTLVAAVVWPTQAIVVNVGDSRAYHMDLTGICRITTDHSVVEDMVRRGELTPQQARVHPRKNLITRAVGTEQTVACDVFYQQLKPSDALLLCSDGLSNTVSEQEILFEVVHGVRRESCCERLLTIANNAGAPDNVTMILVTV